MAPRSKTENRANKWESAGSPLIADKEGKSMVFPSLWLSSENQ
jgi:hypothetical protein